MISEYIAVGKFLPYWQTGVFLIVALIAGKLAYKAKIRHAREKQSKSLKRAEGGILSPETLRIARQIESILAAVISNIDATAKLADTLILNAQCFENPAIRRRVASPPFFSITPQLDKLRPEITETYLQLCDKISDFRTATTGISPSRLQNELEALREIVLSLQGEISENRHQPQIFSTEVSSTTEVVAQSA
jgi:hypothetical protein